MNELPPSLFLITYILLLDFAQFISAVVFNICNKKNIIKLSSILPHFFSSSYILSWSFQTPVLTEPIQIYASNRKIKLGI